MTLEDFIRKRGMWVMIGLHVLIAAYVYGDGTIVDRWTPDKFVIYAAIGFSIFIYFKMRQDIMEMQDKLPKEEKKEEGKEEKTESVKPTSKPFDEQPFFEDKK